MPTDIYDVAIVGAGPAGLFAAQSILEGAENLSAIILDRGPGVGSRRCPADNRGCHDCKVCTVLCGIGGAGLHSDGKLVLDLDSGGHLNEFADLSSTQAAELVQTVERTLRRFDGKSEEGPQIPNDQAEDERNRYRDHGLELKLYPVRHLGTLNLQQILGRFVEHLKNTTGPRGSTVVVHTKREVVAIQRSADGFNLRTSRGSVGARRVVLAIGKSGAQAARRLLKTAGVAEVVRPVWIGVRIQVEAEAARELMALSFDPKISVTDERGRVKTHCFCRNGSLLIMKYRNAYLVGGHSPYTVYNRSQWNSWPGGSTAKVNFNVLASRYLDDSTVQEVLDTFRRAGGKSVVAQDMASFLEPDRLLPDIGAALENRVPAKTADIRSILDSYLGIGTSIANFLRNLASLHPGLVAPDNIVYAPAMEWDYGTLEVNSEMETLVHGLYAVGDGAGLSQGIVHAGATGLLAGQAICRELGSPHPEDASQTVGRA